MAIILRRGEYYGRPVAAGQWGEIALSVATDAGFADQSHFTRAFARATGVTPAEYRRRVQSVPER